MASETREERRRRLAGVKIVGRTPEESEKSRQENLQFRSRVAKEGRAKVEADIQGREAFQETQEKTAVAEESLATPQELEPTLIEKKFEAEGGFQELEGRGERSAETIAEVGLIPAKVVGDIVVDGIEKITGKTYDRKTTAELAETDFGKLLGVSTAAVGIAALLGAVGTVTAGAVGATTGTIATSLGVSKGAVAGAGVLGLATITGLNTDVIIDKLLDRKSVNEIESSINTIGANSGAIEGTYLAGGYGNNPGLAIAKLQQLNDNILIVEQQVQQAIILDERVKQSGAALNIMADLNEQRDDVTERAALILRSVPNFDPAQIAEQIQTFTDIRDGNRQALIDRGLLREFV